MHVETAGTAWSGLPSDDEEGPWEVRRGYFLFCERNAMWRENYGSLCCFKAIVLNVFSHAHAFSRKSWTDDLFFSLAILWRKSISTLHVRRTDDLEVFQSCPIRCDPNQKWRPLLLKPGLLELQFERTQGRKIQDAAIVWVYQFIHAKYFTSSDPHQVACHHDITFCILFDKYSDSFHSDMPFG